MRYWGGGAAFFKRKKHVGRWPAHCLGRGFFYRVLLHSFRLQWRLNEPQLETGPLTQKLEIPSNTYRTGSLPLRSSNIFILHSSCARQLPHVGRKKPLPVSSSHTDPVLSMPISQQCSLFTQALQGANAPGASLYWQDNYWGYLSWNSLKERNGRIFAGVSESSSTDTPHPPCAYTDTD